MNANVSKLLNEQINKEFYSAYLYLDFANSYASVGLDGFENWYRVQAQEERDHGPVFTVQPFSQFCLLVWIKMCVGIQRSFHLFMPEPICNLQR